MTYLMYDLAVVFILLFFAWRGYKTGLVLTLCSCLTIFVAFIGATLVSNTLAEPVARTVQPLVEEHVLQFLEDQEVIPPSALLDSSALGEFQVPLEDALDALKESVLYRGFADTIQESLNNGMVAATANATRIISDYVARQLAKLVLFLVSFLLILVLWSILSRVLDLAFHLPILSTFNRWSGGVLGLLKGALILFIACQLLKSSFLPLEAIQQSYLLKYFCTASPLTLFS